MLDDHILKAQTMHGSVYIKPFEEEMDTWEKKLILMQEILDLWISVSMPIEIRTLNHYNCSYLFSY